MIIERLKILAAGIFAPPNTPYGLTEIVGPPGWSGGTLSESCALSSSLAARPGASQGGITPRTCSRTVGPPNPGEFRSDHAARVTRAWVPR